MINVKNVIGQTLKFNAVNIVSVLISIPTQILLGIYLLPEEYGVISLIGLWNLYSGMVNPGMLTAGLREIPYWIGKKDIQKSEKVKNISISSDFLYSIFPFMVIFFASFFYNNKMIKFGLIITSFYFIINRIQTYWFSINFAIQKFSIVAIGKLLSVVFPPLIIILFISHYGVYAVIIAPLFGTVIAGLYFVIKGPINYRFQFEWNEVIRLIKVGFVLSLFGIIFYGYKMADTTMIASLLPLKDLGLFSFSMNLVLFGINYLVDFGRVLEPILYEDSGKRENPKESFNNTKNIMIYMSIIIAMIIPFIQVGYGFVVKIFVPKYNESIISFIILSNMLYLASMTTIPNIILNSVVINKQRMVMIVYALGLIINVFFDYLMIKNGYGINMIAFITVVSQCLITFILIYLSKNYILKKEDKLTSFLLTISFPFLISIIFSLLYNIFSSAIMNIWLWVIISMISQVIIWSLVILFGYREYFPKQEILNITREIHKIGKKSLF